MLDKKTKDSKLPANRNDVPFMFVFSSLRRHVLDDMLQELHPKGVSILGHSTGFFASSWHAEDFVELMEESGQVDWSRCWSLHLYNSQTKILERFRKSNGSHFQVVVLFWKPSIWVNPFCRGNGGGALQYIAI